MPYQWQTKTYRENIHAIIRLLKNKEFVPGERQETEKHTLMVTKSFSAISPSSSTKMSTFTSTSGIKSHTRCTSSCCAEVSLSNPCQQFEKFHSSAEGGAMRRGRQQGTPGLRREGREGMDGGCWLKFCRIMYVSACEGLFAPCAFVPRQ